MKYLKIDGYDAEEGGKIGNELSSFTAPVNPSSIKVNYGVKYADDDDDSLELGNVIAKKSFTKCTDQTVSFELIVDGTGVIDGNEDAKKSVEEQIELFKKTCYYYVGNNHETPYVKISWGQKSLFKYNNQAFFARIKSFDISYTLFSSNGEPLRATINAVFVGTMDRETETKIKDNQSPDLTHVVKVKAGDTLPVLCEKIYGKRQMFHEIARINNLVSFRYLEPGTNLVFPPIK